MWETPLWRHMKQLPLRMLCLFSLCLPVADAVHIVSKTLQDCEGCASQQEHPQHQPNMSALGTKFYFTCKGQTERNMDPPSASQFHMANLTVKVL